MNSIQVLTAISTMCMSAFTFLMAIGTIYLAIETRISRMHIEAQSKHIAFRSAIQEITENVANLHGWNPISESNPSDSWRNQRLCFESLSFLMNLVVIHPQVWQRTIALIRNLRAAEVMLKTELIDKDKEQAKEFFYRIDIYLKQLACYVATEMKIHGFSKEEASALIENNLMRPARWSYGDSTLTPAAIVAIMEIQPISPFSALPSEPDDPVFADCTLARLVQEAHMSIGNSLPK